MKEKREYISDHKRKAQKRAMVKEFAESALTALALYGFVAWMIIDWIMYGYR